MVVPGDRLELMRLKRRICNMAQYGRGPGRWQQACAEILRQQRHANELRRARDPPHCGDRPVGGIGRA